VAPCTVQQLCGGDVRGGYGVLNGYIRFRGVSLVVGRGCGVLVVLEAGLDALGAVGVAGFVGVVTVGAADGGVGACGSLLAVGEGAWVFLGLVGSGTDSASGAVAAEGRWVSECLAVPALGASSVGDVFLEAAFSVADDELLTADRGFLYIAGEGHDDSGVGFVCSSVSRGEPSRCLALDELGVVGCDAGGDFGDGQVGRDSMEEKLAELLSDFDLFAHVVVGVGISDYSGVVFVDDVVLDVAGGEDNAALH